MPRDILYIGFVLGHGGDAAQMLELAAGMQARGKSVKIVVPDIPTTQLFADQCRERGVEVERSGLIRADPVAPRQVPADLIALFRNNPAELLHLHTGDVCLSRTVPRAMGELNIPPRKVVVTVHSAFDTLVPGDDRAEAWAQAAGARIRCIVSPSRHSLQTQLKYGVSAACLKHIPNGVDLARYQSGDASRIRRELGIGSAEPLIVFTSRLDPQKRPQDGLAAFVRIAEEYPNCHFAFVGAGSLESELNERAEAFGLISRVHQPGHRTDIADWLAAATVWILPTEAENFSLAVLEALAAGCPIVSTLCRGNDEVLVAEQNALIHDVGDVDGIATALRRLLSEPNLCKRLSANARQTSRRYGVGKMVDRYAAVYEGL
jgi:glycosyltransferase involved in cell wall biosynthesis